MEEPEFVACKLYPDENLGRLLRCWFDEMELFYPCFDRHDFYGRLSAFFIEQCICRDRTTRFARQAEHLYFAALICRILAIATYFGAEEQVQNQLHDDQHYRNLSAGWYEESERLLSYVQPDGVESSSDLLKIHIVTVLYMTIHERKDQMAKAMALAVDLAFALNLYDESKWDGLSNREKEFYRLQWFTIYHLDRRVALTTGRSILIREPDFIVSGFDNESFAAYIGWATLSSADEPCCLEMQWPRPSELTSTWFDYIRFQAKWDILVDRLWDKHLSLRARPWGSDAVASDNLLDALRDELPPSLVWDASTLPSFMQLGNTDRTFRIRLIVFETINMLRLHLLSGNDRTPTTMICSPKRSAMVAQDVAADTVFSITSYLQSRLHARPWATYASLLLVQATSCVMPLENSCDLEITSSTYKLFNSIIDAHSCLQCLKLQVSRRAGAKLEVVLAMMTDTLSRASCPNLLYSCEYVDSQAQEFADNPDEPAVASKEKMQARSTRGRYVSQVIPSETLDAFRNIGPRKAPRPL